MPLSHVSFLISHITNANRPTTTGFAASFPLGARIGAIPHVHTPIEDTSNCLSLWGPLPVYTQIQSSLTSATGTMGGKRANENAQMRREEYEAMEAAGGGDDSQEVTQGIPRASADQLKGRRIVRARRPPQRPQAEQDAGSAKNPFANLGAAAAAASSSTNPFARLSQITAAESENPFANLDATVSASKSAKPDFSFVTTSKPAVDSLAATVAPTGKAPSDNTTTPFSLERALQDSLKEFDPQANMTRLDGIIKSAAEQIHEWAQKNPEFSGKKGSPTSQDAPKNDDTNTTSSDAKKEEAAAVDENEAETKETTDKKQSTDDPVADDKTDGDKVEEGKETAADATKKSDE